MPRYDESSFDPPAPVAQVMISAQGRVVSDVTLLIDTGADLTLLPRFALERLGFDVSGESISPRSFVGCAVLCAPFAERFAEYCKPYKAPDRVKHKSYDVGSACGPRVSNDARIDRLRGGWSASGPYNFGARGDMREELDQLIERFRAAQDIAVQCIIHVLKFPLPTTCHDWIDYCERNGIYPLRHLNGISLYAHGYGIELQVEGYSIDFDWGPSGEPDGFDAWRLHRFAETNAAGIRCTYAQAKEWLDEAFRNGELIQIGNLYFDPGRRAHRS